ncbi:MAG: HIT domain-containing protein [Bacillota bacterium]
MCLTCDIIAGKVVPAGGIIYQDDWIILHHCIDINIAGYLIVSPVRHVETYGDLHEAEIRKIGVLTKDITAILSEFNGVEKIYLASFGEETAHFHAHIFPRYKWIIDHHAQDVCLGNKIDGAKLLSICREKYKVEGQIMENDGIRDVVAKVRNRLRKKLGLQDKILQA